MFETWNQQKGGSTYLDLLIKGSAQPNINIMLEFQYTALLCQGSSTAFDKSAAIDVDLPQIQ